MSLRASRVLLAFMLLIGGPSFAQDNQYYAELISDCSMLGLAERNAAFSNSIPLSELQETPFYSQMVDGMTQALDGLDQTRDREGARYFIENMIAGVPDGDIALECFRVVMQLKEFIEQ